jgi:DNA polymerase-3 subunit delta
VSATLAQFEKQIAGSELKPVYLLAGEEHLLVLEAADALRARARALGYAEREILDVDQRFDWNALAQSASAMSLFAQRKLIDLRLPSGRPGVEGSAAIVEYCEDAPPDNVLLITCMEWSSKHGGAWSAAAARIGMFVEVRPMSLDTLRRWIGERMASRGLKPDVGAIAALAERVEGNSLAAAQEIDKLALLHGSAPLNADTLEQLVADSARYDVFKLVDAALTGNATRALRILEGLRAEGEQVPGLMGFVLYRLQQLAASDPARWRRHLVQAARIDRVSKGRETGDAWREFERLLVAIAQPRSGFAKAS